MRWLILSFVLAGCIDDEPLATERVRGQTQAEIAFAKSVLDGLQAQSFDLDREFCGYIGVNGSRTYVASEPTRGRKGSCRAGDPGEMDVLASYHTHGGYSEYHDSEIPSVDDLRADIEEGVDGYISTPGGRVWFSDASDSEARLTCGLKCVASDVDFIEDYDVPKAMDLQALKDW